MRRLNTKNFASNTHGLKYKNYWYEASKGIYDVFVCNNTDEVTFAFNNKPSPVTPYHEAIIKYFNLEVYAK
jgi:hypothetical protein